MLHLAAFEGGGEFELIIGRLIAPPIGFQKG
jgi:hypothetical protein